MSAVILFSTAGRCGDLRSGEAEAVVEQRHGDREIVRHVSRIVGQVAMCFAEAGRARRIPGKLASPIRRPSRPPIGSWSACRR